MGRASNTHVQIRNAYKILVEKPEGKRPVQRLGCRWENTDNIKMDFRVAGLEGVGWINLAQDRVQC
jgi:hypothetical protein